MKKRSDLVFSLVILVCGILVFIKAKNFPGLPEGHPGPGLFPSFIGGGLILCGIFLLIYSVRFQSSQSSGFGGRWMPVFFILLLMGLFPLGYQLAGFFVTIALAIFLTGLLMQLKWLSALFASVFTTGAIYLIFNQILHVPL